MYLYVVVAKLEDYFGITPVVASIEKNQEDAKIAIRREQKYYKHVS